MSAERGEPIRAEQCDSVRVCLDGGWLEVGVGETILQAAERAGREIPTLCFDRRLAPFGACRLCLVGVQGAGAPLPACTTRCHDGMVVDTTDERARRVVRTVLELVLSELPGDPLPGSELDVLARRLGVARSRFAGRTHERRHDERHPYLLLESELCISCGRCVRICDELQGAFALTATGRGFDASIAAGLDSGFANSSCVSCGACAHTCPTGAIRERLDTL
ncbi:MAG TPA: 2Fe-2S iron-sulfur cluster-binding protein [Solirubrobacteraceae bacterium]|nr:2Fe-2S iron-sulfur cluster-binding protein [Solirubrobacteraceae bacterium]